jgi:hypothetical protein
MSWRTEVCNEYSTFGLTESVVAADLETPVNALRAGNATG